MNTLEHLPRPIRSLLLAVGALLAALAAPAALAVQDCDIGGVHVNPANGATTAGKTGIMRCVERDTGVVQREQELRNGEFVGLVRYYQNGKLERELSVNAQGNREGVGRDFSPVTGKVVREAEYRNGTAVGLGRSFYPDGARRRVSYRDPAGKELAAVEFTPSGKLRELLCGERALLGPGVDEDALCGFAPPGRPATVTLYDDKDQLRTRLTHVGGRLTGSDSFWNNGQPRTQETIGETTVVEREFGQDGTRLREVRWTRSGRERFKESELEYHANGTLVRERRWEQGELVLDRSFYLNGQQKSETKISRSGRQAVSEVSEFHDNGKLSSTGTYVEESRGRRYPVGAQRRFDADGHQLLVRTYDDKGRLTREQEFDAKGQVLRDDAVFEDGSRKAFSATPR